MAKPILTQEYLKECLNYDLETGVFTWKTRPRHHFKTDKAMKMWHSRDYVKSPGCLKEDSGYVVIGLNYHIFRAHRLAWLYMTGTFPQHQIDHINHIRSDNRWENLRLADNAENHKNMSMNRDNRSGINGVSLHKQTGKWEAYISFNNQRIHLGRYENIECAAMIREIFNQLFGFHENHGASQCQS